MCRSQKSGISAVKYSEVSIIGDIYPLFETFHLGKNSVVQRENYVTDYSYRLFLEKIIL